MLLTAEPLLQSLLIAFVLLFSMCGYARDAGNMVKSGGSYVCVVVGARQ